MRKLTVFENRMVSGGTDCSNNTIMNLGPMGTTVLGSMLAFSSVAFSYVPQAALISSLGASIGYGSQAYYAATGISLGMASIGITGCCLMATGIASMVGYPIFTVNLR